MMIGTPIGSNSLILLYELFVFGWIIGFAVYDLLQRRVPDRALVFFCPFALAAPLIRTAYSLRWQDTFSSFGISLTGAAAGFIILLAAALISSDGMGIGGGDIKLTAIMGFIYGPYRITGILLVASALASVAVIMIGQKKQEENSTLPFVPFLAAGSLVSAAAYIF